MIQSDRVAWIASVRNHVVPPVVSVSAIPREAGRVAILVNPKAGPSDSRRRVDRLEKLLQKRGFKTEIFTDLAEATSQANRWHAEGSLRTLVGVGGDGTAAELANRIDEGIPLTLFPGGNSNLLARYFRLSKDPEALCRTIVDGVTARIDVGRANGRIFLLMASCGFDAEVVRRLHRRRTGHISLYTYGKPILETIWSYPYPEIRVHWQGDEEARPSLSSRWLFVFNLPCYGGGLRVAPQADGSDGLLDVCGLRRGRLWPGLCYLAGILSHRHHRMADCTMHHARKLRITAETEVPYQLDGDPGGVLPLDIETLPGRLTLVVPQGAVKNHLDKTNP